VRADLFRQLAARVTFELPALLVEREMDRRVEEFGRQLWRERAREVPLESVGASAHA
jgi:FKBP-type peptidyl-prolyl cis-trans isomerase (trigger factor)